jgi:hypothetical protein
MQYLQGEKGLVGEKGDTGPEGDTVCKFPILAYRDITIVRGSKLSCFKHCGGPVVQFPHFTL